MSTSIDIRALARLARLSISDAEVTKLEGEIPAILSFVETLQKVTDGIVTVEKQELRTVMRDDELTHERGTYTERILAEAPAREGDKVAVKKVLSKGE
ncbi:aspartyl/glutamyl-tRNA amidotransferase subunit C [bacterium]|nr:aspartyl/glutamyl-tRNA amidotransferase subunit C [bacterium]